MPLTIASEAYATKWEVIVYGVPGVGKTSLFAGAPKVLFIVVDDNGYIVLQNHPNAANIHLFHTRKWSELVMFIKGLIKLPLLKEIDTIVFDTISEAQTLERLAQVGGASLDDNWKFNQHIYTVNNFRIQALVRTLKTTGKNIAWLCHMVQDQIMGPGNQIVKVVTRPALSGTLLAAVQAGVDGQFFYTERGVNRILEIRSNDVQTKSRFKASRPLQNPTWDDMQALLTSRMKPN